MAVGCAKVRHQFGRPIGSFQLPGGELARHPEIRARVLCGRGAVGLWSGDFDEAARVLHEGMAAQTSVRQDRPAGCVGQLALAEAMRGRLRRAAKLAAQATEPTASPLRSTGQDLDPAALVALAWVHLERNELREAASQLKQVDAALAAGPDKLIGAVAYLVAAGGALARGRTAAVMQIIARARSGRPVPAWLDRQLSLIQSRAYATAGDFPAALAAAERVGTSASPEVAVTLAHAWATSGDGDRARRALTHALVADGGASDRVRVQAWLVDARLSYISDDRRRGRRSLASALRLAEPEQLRLPFVVEHSWLGPVLRRDPALASTHRCLLGPALRLDHPPAPPDSPDQPAILAIEPLSEREREVLGHVSCMLNTAEIASEMFITVNTVKTHLRTIYRKLAADNRGQAVRRARQLGLI
jgi:LuxR family transcriptional regulator, maltose regulon positive regulatory protein